MSAHPRRRPRERAASGDLVVRLVPQVCAPVLGTNLGEGKSEALLRAPSVPSLARSTPIRSLRSQSPETLRPGSCPKPGRKPGAPGEPRDRRRPLARGGGGGDEQTFPLQENDSGLTPADYSFVKPL